MHKIIKKKKHNRDLSIRPRRTKFRSHTLVYKHNQFVVQKMAPFKKEIGVDQYKKTGIVTVNLVYHDNSRLGVIGSYDAHNYSSLEY